MKRALSIAFALLPLAGGVAPARADSTRADDARAEARTLAGRGDEHFYAGRCDKAIPLWRQADALFHAPTIQLRVARCQAILGKVVEAAATLEAVAASRPNVGEPPAFHAARDDAKREIAAVRARIATLRVSIHARGGAIPFRVEIDGAAQPDGVSAFSIDPGEHLVVVRAGAAAWQRTLHLHDGESLACEVALWTEPAPSPARIQRALGLAAFGAGGAALAVGIGFAVSALGGSHELDSICGMDRAHCPASAQGTIDRVRVHSAAADAALIGGAALVAAGAVVLATTPSKRDEPVRVRFAASPFSATLALEL